MFILNPIIGVIAVSFFSIIVLPVALVIFFLESPEWLRWSDRARNSSVPKSCRS